VLIEAIALSEAAPRDMAGPERLQALGQHLTRLANLSDLSLGELLTERLRSANRRFEQELTERAARGALVASPYAADVARFFERVRASEARRDYWIPLDLRSTDGVAGAESRTRDILRRVGELLVQWPAIVGAARILREQGVRVSVPA
jgi:hypothetical protein